MTFQAILSPEHNVSLLTRMIPPVTSSAQTPSVFASAAPQTPPISPKTHTPVGGPGLPPRKIRIIVVDPSPETGKMVAELVKKEPPLQAIFCATRADVSARLTREVDDVVIVDPKPLGAEGFELLEELKSRFPSVLRFVLAEGDDSNDVTRRAVRLAHQYIPKPCDVNLLQRLLMEGISSMASIRSPKVVETLSRLEAVPSRKANFSELIRLLYDESTPVESICASLAKEPGMSARLLKIANSPIFGKSGSIETLDDAIGVLGINLVVNMAVAHKMFAVEAPSPASRINVEELWSHCIRVSMIARRIGNHLRVSRNVINDACTAAILHDIGKLVLAYSLPEGYAAACSRAFADQMPVWQAECAIFGNNHAGVGGSLLKLWGLPAGVVHAVAMHHAPHCSGETTPGPATLLHIADAVSYGSEKASAPCMLDSEHLRSLKLPEMLNYWLPLVPGD